MQIMGEAVSKHNLILTRNQQQILLRMLIVRMLAQKLVRWKCVLQ